MRTCIILLVIFLLLGCGKQVIDPEFASYVASFESAAADNGKNLHVSTSITFGTVDTDGVQAECKDGAVIVDHNSWVGAVETDREEIIFHELGHCVLGRAHLNTKVWDTTLFYSVAISVMNISRVDVNAYRARRAVFLNELFSN